MVKLKKAVKPKTELSKKTEKKPPQKKVTFAPDLKCLFCGKTTKTARRLVALVAPSKNCICDECIEVCILLLLKESPHEWATRITRIFAVFAEKNKKLLKQSKKQLKPKKGVKKSNA